MPIWKRVRTVWGPDNIGPVRLVQPNERTRDLIIEVASMHPTWGPLRIFEELREDGVALTAENVHWVLCEYKLRNYSDS